MKIEGSECRTDKYTMVAIEEYNGKLSLTAGYESKDGEWKPNWCEIETKNGKRKMPIKIALGDNVTEAAGVLSFLYSIVDRLGKK